MTQTDGAIQSLPDVAVETAPDDIIAILRAQLDQERGKRMEAEARAIKAEAEAKKSKFDHVTGLRNRLWTHPILSNIVRNMLQMSAAQKLLAGVPASQLTDDDAEQLNLILAFYDISALKLANEWEGSTHATGDKLLKSFADALQGTRLARTCENFQVLDHTGEIVTYKRYELCRYAGDEFLAYGVGVHPDQFGDATRQSLVKFASADVGLPIRSHADEGITVLPEAIVAAYQWRQVFGDFPSEKDFLTFIIMTLIGIADCRSKLKKAENRLYNLAYLYATNRPVYKQIFPYMVAGATLQSPKQTIDWLRQVIRAMRDASTGSDGMMGARRAGETIAKRAVEVGLEDILDRTLVSYREVAPIGGDLAEEKACSLLHWYFAREDYTTWETLMRQTPQRRMRLLDSRDET